MSRRRSIAGHLGIFAPQPAAPRRAPAAPAAALSPAAAASYNPIVMPAPLALIGPIGAPELLVILLIGLLLFGSRLPEVGRSLGRGLLEFKRGLRGLQDGIRDVEDEADRRVDAEMRAPRNEPLPKPAPEPEPPVVSAPEGESREEQPISDRSDPR